MQVTARSGRAGSVHCHTATRVLVAHEQHLQAVGSDARLLLLLQQLRQLGASVSLLVRASTRAARRQPPTHEIARLLGAANLSAVPLGRGGAPVARAPAVYEMGGGRAFQQLLRHEQFDLVLVGLWFWYDPQPSFAEMLVPLVAGVARRDGDEARAGAGGATGGGPLVALLCDDAHSERAARLQHEVPAWPPSRGRAAANLNPDPDSTPSPNLHPKPSPNRKPNPCKETHAATRQRYGQQARGAVLTMNCAVH